MPDIFLILIWYDTFWYWCPVSTLNWVIVSSQEKKIVLVLFISSLLLPLFSCFIQTKKSWEWRSFQHGKYGKSDEKNVTLESLWGGKATLRAERPFSMAIPLNFDPFSSPFFIFHLVTSPTKLVNKISFFNACKTMKTILSISEKITNEVADKPSSAFRWEMRTILENKKSGLFSIKPDSGFNYYPTPWMKTSFLVSITS